MEREALSLEETQQESLKILSKIDEICRKENLKYFLAYGTLLGAIRHNGFIPWDDDVDVMMPRKDYLKLKKYFIEHAEELKPFKLCYRENTENYEYYLPRVVNMDFKYINLFRKKPEMDIGTFVDIYPIDNYGNDRSAKKVFDKIKRKNINYVFYLSGISPTSKYKTLIMYPLHIIQRIIKGKNYQYRINKEIDDLISKSFNDSDRYVGIPSWTFTFKQYKREWLEDHIEKDFEGKMFYIPKFYDDILKMEYGDYMKLPPEDQRKPYHGYKIVKREK